MSEKYIISGSDNQLIDIRSLPIIEMNRMHDLFLLDGIDKQRRYMDTYSYNGLPVPRVSNILKECIGKENLMFWSAKLGTQQFLFEKKKTTRIGSIVHEMIEYYLLNRKDLDISSIIGLPNAFLNEIKMAYSNFKRWFTRVEDLGYEIEVIATEQKLSCPYYGGTADLIVRINGKVYIVDYKTSKQISYEYIIQTCAYMWIINNGFAPHLPHIDGIGIIRVDKFEETFEDLFLNEYVPEQKMVLDNYTKGFGSLLFSYYHLTNMRYLFSSYSKTYRLEDSII